MPDTITLLSVTLLAATISWSLAWFLKGREAKALGDELHRERADFQTRLAEQSRLTANREAELAAVRASVDELQAKLTAISEERARLNALHESITSVAAQHSEELARLRAQIVDLEGTRDAARDQASVLQADLARLTTALDQERRTHNDWTVAARQAEAEMKGNLANLTQDRDTARERIAALESEIARRTTLQEQERLAHQEKLKVYEAAEEQLRAAVKAMAADALNANNEAFLTLAQEKLGALQTVAAGDFEQKQKTIQELVSPVATLLEKLQADIKVAEQNRVETRTEIIAQVRQVAELVPALQKETSQLARSLRHSGTRGQWGELQLRKSLELAGLVEGLHYTFQARLETADGHLIPDVIVHLPGGGNIVIDAKTPMQAFLDAHATTDEDARARYMEQHVSAVRQHTVLLGGKSYAAQVTPSPDFVVMYVPVEAALGEALGADVALLEDAANRDVMLAGPLVLIALLRTVAFGWRQHQVAERAEDIAALGGELYDRIATVVDRVVTLGRRLDRTVQAYNEASASFESRLVPGARRLRDLHVKTTKTVSTMPQIERRSRLIALPAPETDVAVNDVDQPSPALDAALDLAASL